MIIKKANIIAFGKWEQKEFSFDSNLQLFYGENEAGKSTIYQFIRGVLFGFSTKKHATTNYEPKNGGLYGGNLVVDHPIHGIIKIERIKTSHKGKAILTFEDGQVGDEATLQTILSPLTKELFDEVFSLQQEQLVGINTLNEDKLQRLLLTIGLAGSKNLLEKQEFFHKEQQELYKPTGRKPELNRQLKVYKELKNKIVNKEQSEEQYQSLLAQAIQSEKELDDLRDKLEQEKNQVNKRELQEQLFPKWEERNQLQQVIHYGKTEELEEQELQELTANYQSYCFLKEQEEQFEEEKNKQIQNSVESPSLIFYLEQEDKLKKVIGKQSQVENLARTKHMHEVMKEEKEREKEQIEGQLNVSADNVFFPTLEITGKLKMLAEEEEKSQTALKESERAFDFELDKKEQMEGRASHTERNSLSSQLVKVGIPIGLIFVSIYLFLTGRTIVGVVLIFASTLFLVANYITGKNKTKSFDKELNHLETRIEQLAEKTEQRKLNYQRIMDEKEDIGHRYQFSMAKTCQEWLMELTLRERLRDIVIELNGLGKNIEVEERELQTYRADLEFAREWFSVNTMEITALYQQINYFIEDMEQKKSDSLDASKGQSRWIAPLQDIERRRDELMGRMKPVMEKYQVSSMTDLPIWLHQQEQFESRKRKLAELNDLLNPVFEKSTEYTLEKIQEKQMNSYRQLTFLEKEEKHIQKGYQKNKYEIHQMERDGTLQDLYQEEANERSKIEELMEQWIGYRLSEAVIHDLLDFLSTQQLPVLLATATAYFKSLTKGNYQKCAMEDGKLVVYNKEKKVYHLTELSTGTKDQLYISLRMSFIQLHSQEKLFPVIIDDGWLHYDSTRKQLFFKLLDKISKDVQIICFSSDNEIATYFNQRNYAVERI